MLIDSHCHLDRLDLEPYDGELARALEAARENGVGHMLCVSIDLQSWPDMAAQVAPFEQVSLSVGVHPNHRHEPTLRVDDLRPGVADPRVVAIGETGLDYFRSEGDLEWQRHQFRTHIRAAREFNKPLIVHSREAREDTLRILAEEGAQQAGGVMHCFAEDRETAWRAIDLGFYISFSGIVTFKSATELKEVARSIPLDRILVETDSPYLAPVPHRGRPNEPKHVRHVAECIAQLREVELAEIERATTENFWTLFAPRS